MSDSTPAVHELFEGSEPFFRCTGERGQLSELRVSSNDSGGPAGLFGMAMAGDSTDIGRDGVLQVTRRRPLQGPELCLPRRAPARSLGLIRSEP